MFQTHTHIINIYTLIIILPDGDLNTGTLAWQASILPPHHRCFVERDNDEERFERKLVHLVTETLSERSILNVTTNTFVVRVVLGRYLTLQL